MNRERAKELLPIMTAFADGKEIECWTVFGWGTDDTINTESDIPYRIKPTPKMRPMTRGEVLYVLSTEHCALTYQNQDPFLLMEAIEEDVSLDVFMRNLQEYHYAIIDKSGNPIDGWHKFETADTEEAKS